MNEQECLEKMIAPGQIRASKPYRNGVIQIHISRACDMSCFGCTQGSNLAGSTTVITPEQFELAVRSLGFIDGMGPLPPLDVPNVYFGVVGVFGGNPALSPHFEAYCEILKRYVPYEQRGLWCNHPRGKGRMMRGVFNPSVSNLNVHLSQEAFDQFQRDWPEARLVGLHDDSRHSPPFVAMKDVVRSKQLVGDTYTDLPDDSRIWELISNCDINQHWSAMIGVFRGELRAWFCEVAGAQAMLHQHEEDYPDTGTHLAHESQFVQGWWQQPMSYFKDQVRKHCFDCGVPLRGYGELAQTDKHERAYSDPVPAEQTSATHSSIYLPKRPHRKVDILTDLVQLDIGKIQKVNHYIQNSHV